MNRKFLDDIDSKYGSNSNAAVILVSGNRQALGTIVNANHELFQILGFTKAELVNENISIIMPALRGKNHNAFLEGYFDKQGVSVTSNKNTVLKEQLVFPQHIKGYLVPCVKLVRHVPNLDNGIQFLAFINKAEDIEEVREGDEGVKNENVLLILLDEQWRVQGFNTVTAKMCCKDESFTPIYKYLEGEQKISLAELYPRLLESENEELMRSEAGLVIRLDLGLLKKAIASEVLDYYSDDNSEKNEHEATDSQKNSKAAPKSDDESLMRFIATNQNIKIKEYCYCNGTLKYKICTFLSSDHISNRIPSYYAVDRREGNSSGHEQKYDRNHSFCQTTH